MRLGLVPSPFVGPSVWQPVADRLRDAIIADYGGVEAPGWYDATAQRVVDQMDHEPWIAVLHSSAGPFAPSLATFAKQLRGLVFVDAVLPHPGTSAVERTPLEQSQRLRSLIGPDGLLAEWSSWFPKGVLEAWVPDTDARAAALSDIRRVPFAFLEARAPDKSRVWEELPATFLKLSAGFERNAARAEALGWQVKRVESNHLGMVSHPDLIATVLDDLR